jgi:hypothetical protein
MDGPFAGAGIFWKAVRLQGIIGSRAEKLRGGAALFEFISPFVSVPQTGVRATLLQLTGDQAFAGWPASQHINCA